MRKIDLFAIEQDLAFIRLNDASQYFYERGFSSAILSKNRVNTASVT